MLDVLVFLSKLLNLRFLNKLAFKLLASRPEAITVRDGVADIAERLNPMLPYVTTMITVGGLGSENTVDIIKAIAKITNTVAEIDTEEKMAEAIQWLSLKYNPFKGADEADSPLNDQRKEEVLTELKLAGFGNPGIS